MTALSVLQTLGENLAEALLVASCDTLTIEYANTAAETLSERCQDELRGQSLSALLPMFSSETMLDCVNKAGAASLEVVGELLTSRGRRVRVRVRLARITLDGETWLLCSLRPLNHRERTAALLRAQRDLAVALSGENSLSQALASVVQTAIRLSDMDGGGIYLADPRTGALVLHYHTGLPEEFIERVSYLPTDTPQTRLVHQGIPLYLAYDQLYERMGASMDDVRRRAGIGSIAVVPILSGQEVIGSLNIFSRARRPIPPAARHILEALATQAGSAIGRIRAEQARRAQEQIARTLLNATPDSAVLLNRDFVIQAINQAGAQFLGAPPEVLVGRPLLEGVPAEIAALYASHLSQVFVSGQPVDFVYDRCERILSVAIYPLPTPDGEIEQVAMYGRDITEQYLSDLALQRQRDLLAAVAQATSCLVTGSDLDTAIADALTALGEASVADWLYIFQFTTDEDTGEKIARLAYRWVRKNTAHLFNWNDPALQGIPLRGRERLVEYLRTGEHIDGDTPLWREYQQTDALLAVSPSPLLLPLFVQGELWGVIGFGHHIPTQTWSEEDRHALRTLANVLGGTITRHRAMRRLQQERDFAETLRDTGMAITSTLDLEVVFARILDQVGRIVPYDTASIFLVEGDEVHRVSRKAADPQRFPKPAAAERVKIADFPLLQRLIETRQALVVSDTYRHPEWRIVTEYVRSWLGAPIVNRGRTLGFLALHSTQPGFYRPEHADAIAPIAVQAGIALQNAQLFADMQRLERTKSEMIRIASHDLRSPLSRLTMLVNRWLARADLDAEPALQRDLLRMRDAAAEMEQLIDEILSLERIEARHRASQLVDWCALVRRAIDALQPEIAARGHQLTLLCPEVLPTLRGDPAQLYYAAYNLLHNAIKYTPPGGHIEVRVRQSRYGDQDTLVFEVEDNGTGIAPEQQQALFQPFFRANSATADELPGVGLGLTVVKAAVEAHQGRVYCESTPGQGSLFGFWVPLSL
jgi:PAS domain S-box-containing protein